MKDPRARARIHALVITSQGFYSRLSAYYPPEEEERAVSRMGDLAADFRDKYRASPYNYRD